MVLGGGAARRGNDAADAELVKAQAQLFGNFALTVGDGTSIAPTGRRARALIAFLLLSPRHEATRDRLCGLLWGERGEHQARSSLRQCLFEVRKSTKPIGVDLLEIGRDKVALNIGAITIDHGWRKLTDETDIAVSAAINGLALIGDAQLLEDLQVGEPFADWLLQTRTSVDRALAQRVYSLLDYCERVGDSARLFALADEWLVRDPLDERVTASAIRCALAEGSAADARRRFAVLQQALRDELQVEPSELVQEAMRGAHGRTVPTGAQIASARLQGVNECESGAGPAQPPPLQAHLTLASRWAFVGRSEERALLSHAWNSAVEGRGNVVLLSGEAGIGKTELAADFARRAHAAGAITLFGYCNEHVQLPYRPFAAGLDHFVTHAPSAVLERHLAVHGGVLASLLPALRQRCSLPIATNRGDGESNRFALFDAVNDLFISAAGLAPVVLILDDLQWASVSDLQMFNHLSRSVDAHRLLIVATIRDSELGSNPALVAQLADLRRNPSVVRKSLEGLAESAVAEWVAAAGFADASATSVSSLCRGTAGNPFFIGELLRSWADIRQGAGGGVTVNDVPLPDGIREVVEQRITRLRPDTIALLGLAAVIGQHFELGLAAEVLGESMSEEALVDAVEDASSVGLIEEIGTAVDQYRFRHAIIQTALYHGLSSVRRRRLHRQVADALEARRGAGLLITYDMLAYHWSAAATSQNNGKAVEYLKLAGDEAAETFAFEAAAASYTRALALLDADQVVHDERRCEILLNLGNAQRAGGDSMFRQTMIMAADCARAIGDPVYLARAALGSGHANGLQWGNDVDGDLVSAYEEALAALGDRDPALRVRLMSQLAAELRYGPSAERRISLATDAITQARQIGDSQVLASAIVARILVIESPFTLVERLELTRELEALAATIRSPQLLTHSAQLRFDALLQSGDIDGAVQALDRCERAAIAQRTPFCRLFPQLLNTILSLMRGDAGAQSQIEAFFSASSAIGLPMAQNIFAAQLFDIVVRKNASGAWLDQIRAAIAQFPLVTTFRVILPYTLAEVGRFEDAHVLMDELAATDFDVPRNLNWASTVCVLSEAAATLGDARPAQIHYDAVAQVADQVGLAVGVKCYGSMAYPAGLFAGLLGRKDEATAHLRTAIATNDRIGAAPAAVASRRALATQMIAQGKGDAARPLIATARKSAQSLDLVAEQLKLDELDARLARLASFSAA